MPSNTNQDAFINNIRQALGHSAQSAEARSARIFSDPEPVPAAQAAHLDRITSRDRQEQLALLDNLVKEAAPLNMTVAAKKDAAEVSAAIAALVASTQPEWGDTKSLVQWDHPLVRELDLETALKDQQVPVHTAAYTGEETDDDQKNRKRQAIRQQVTDAYIGVTSADFCLADTATLVMRSRPKEARSVSLLPSIHVAVVRLDQLRFDLKELYAELKWADHSTALPHHMVFISGPSKTADIELVMVHGAHGPRALYLYVITG